MRELIFATTNSAKVEQIRGALSGVVEIKGLTPQIKLPAVVEDGKSAVENARKKALTYASHLQQTVMSMDNALYLVGLRPEQQPGLFVRTPFGISKRLSDDEMLTYYSKLISTIGEKAEGYWEFGICIATPTGEVFETTIKQKVILSANHCEEVLPGYPLDSFLINPFTRRFVAQESKEERAEFWEKTIGKELKEFITTIKILV